MSETPKVDVGALTQAERQSLFLHLVEAAAGPLVLPCPGTPGAVVVPLVSNGPIPPAERTQWGVREHTVSRCPQVTFRPRRLVILEPEYARVETEVVTVVEGPWWARRKRAVERGRKVMTIAHRGGWRIHGLTTGQQSQMLPCANVSGDAFGPDSEPLFLAQTCLGAHVVMLQISNARPEPAPFVAVLVGERVTDAEAEAERAAEAAAFEGRAGAGA